MTYTTYKLPRLASDLSASFTLKVVTHTNMEACSGAIEKIQKMREEMDWGTGLGSKDAEAYVESPQVRYFLIQRELLAELGGGPAKSAEEVKTFSDVKEEETKKTVGAITLFTGKHAETGREVHELGSFIIQEAITGGGLGTKVFDLLFELYNIRDAGLISSLRAEEHYKKRYHFQPLDRVSHFTLTIPAIESKIEKTKILKVNSVQLERLVAYDTKVSRIYRGGLLRQLIKNSEISFISERKMEDGTREIVGYALARSLRRKGCYRVSIYANNKKETESILDRMFTKLAQLAASMPEKKVEVVVTVLNSKEKEFDKWLKKNPEKYSSFAVAPEKHALMFYSKLTPPSRTNTEATWGLLAVDSLV